MSIRAFRSPVYPKYVRPVIALLVWILPVVGGLLVMLATDETEPATKFPGVAQSIAINSGNKIGVKSELITDVPISKKEEWYEILTVHIYKYSPVRAVAFMLVLFSWILSLALGKAIGMNNASMAVALKYGLLPYFTLLTGLLLFCVSTSRRLNSKIKENYSSSEIKQFLKEEDAIINLETLNLFSAGVFSYLAPKYAQNKFEKNKFEKNSNRESMAKIFLLFFLIIFHWWYVYMSPRGAAEIVYEIKFQGFLNSVKKAFLITLPWLIFTYIIVISSASYFGATAIDLTK